MKRIFSTTLVLAMLFTCCGGVAFAAEVPDMRASLTLSDYGVILTAGASQGTVNINYDVRSSKAANSVGVESISFYKADGRLVVTINGSTGNGLIRTNSSIHVGDYSHKLASGVSYYAEVTVFARVGSEYDSRTVTTGTVRVP